MKVHLLGLYRIEISPNAVAEYASENRNIIVGMDRSESNMTGIYPVEHHAAHIT
jgi:hypothetical protein